MPDALPVVEVDWDADGTFSDISGRVENIAIKRGIDPGKHYANNDTATFICDNADRELSPENSGSSLQPYITYQNRVIRASIQGVAQFTGLIEDIMPAPLKYGDQRAQISAVGIKKLLDQGEYYPPVYQDLRVDEIAALMAQELPIRIPGLATGGVVGTFLPGTDGPLNLADIAVLQQGYVSFPYAGDALHGRDSDSGDRFFYEPGGDKKLKITTRWEFLKDLIEAEGGLLYFTAAGKLAVCSRYYLAEKVTIDYTLTNDFQAAGTRYQTPLNIPEYFNRVDVKYKPRAEAAVKTTVWTSNQSYDVPASGQAIVEVIFDSEASATNIAVGADQVISSDGMTWLDFELMRATAQRARFRLVNPDTTAKSTLAGGLTLVGNAVSINSGFATTRDIDGIRISGEKPLQKTIRAIATNDEAADLADFLLQWHKDNRARFRSVGLRKLNPTASDRTLVADIGTRLRMIDTQTGSDAEYHVLGKQLNYDANAATQVDVVLTLQRATNSQPARYGKDNYSANVTLGKTSEAERLAQSFTVSRDCTVARVRLWLRTVGTSPTGMLQVVIQGDSSGSPDGTNITNGKSAHVDISDTTIINTGYQWVEFEFSTPPSLTASTTYWLKLEYGDAALVAHYRLEETSGTRYDAWGTNDLTDRNTVTSNPGKQGTAGQFTRAAGEYLDLSSDLGADFDTDGLTVSVFVYADSIPGAGVNHFIAGEWVVDPGLRWLLFLRGTGSGNFAFQVRDGSSTSQNVHDATAGSLSTATWYHVVGRWTPGSTVDIFVDNVKDSIATTITALASTTPDEFAVGGAGSGSNTFDGRLDEVMVFNRALSDAEISALYNSGNGLPFDRASFFTSATDYVEWGVDDQRQGIHDKLLEAWTFDDSSDIGASWSGSNDLTNNGAAVSQLGWQKEPDLHKPIDTNGTQGRGVAFDGANQYLSIADNAALSLEASMEGAIWIEPQELAGTAQAIFSKWYTAGQKGYELRLNSSNQFEFAVSNDGTAEVTVTDTTTLYTSRRYLVQFYHEDGVEIGIRVNGNTFTTQAHTTGIFDGTDNFAIGARADASADFQGMVDEALLFDDLLTTAERDFIYNSGDGRQLHELLGYINGQMKSETSGSWAAETADACMEVYAA